jgi:hypothetical protein
VTYVLALATVQPVNKYPLKSARAGANGDLDRDTGRILHDPAKFLSLIRLDPNLVRLCCDHTPISRDNRGHRIPKIPSSASNEPQLLA